MACGERQGRELWEEGTIGTKTPRCDSVLHMVGAGIWGAEKGGAGWSGVKVMKAKLGM